jgi:hypothetical protein
MQRTDLVTTSQRSRGPQVVRRLAAITARGAAPQGLDRRGQLALSHLQFMVFLLIQFGLGMGINLFVTIPQQHAGAGASNFVIGYFESVVWGIVHGGLLVATHVVLGLLIVLSAINTIVRPAKAGLRGTAWASAAGTVCVLVAAINGAAFLTYHQDLNSLLMALGFGSAMLCYIVSLYLVSRPSGTAAASMSGTPAPSDVAQFSG